MSIRPFNVDPAGPLVYTIKQDGSLPDPVTWTYGADFCPPGREFRVKSAITHDIEGSIYSTVTNSEAGEFALRGKNCFRQIFKMTFTPLPTFFDNVPISGDDGSAVGTMPSRLG
jgi:hypothetical protein